MEKYIRLGLAALSTIALSVVSCGSSEGGGSESEAEAEGETIDDNTIGALECADDCTTLVLDSVILPTNQNPYQCDIDGDGANENQLGGIIGIIGGSNDALQDSLDESLEEGNAIMLAAVQADSLADDPEAGLQVWIGEDTDDDPANNLTGSGALAVASSSSSTSAMGGSISGGEIAFGPAGVTLAIPLLGNEPLLFELVATQVAGELSADPAIDGGVICGGLPRDIFDSSVAPGLAAAINDGCDVLAACKEAGKKKCPDDLCSIGLGLADGNSDGTVTPEEFRTSEAIQSFLPDDLDLFVGDSAEREFGTDGEMDSISLGVGFTAVGAQFEVP